MGASVKRLEGQDGIGIFVADNILRNYHDYSDSFFGFFNDFKGAGVLLDTGAFLPDKKIM